MPKGSAGSAETTRQSDSPRGSPESPSAAPAAQTGRPAPLRIQTADRRRLLATRERFIEKLPRQASPERLRNCSARVHPSRADRHTPGATVQASASPSHGNQSDARTFIALARGQATAEPTIHDRKRGETLTRYASRRSVAGWPPRQHHRLQRRQRHVARRRADPPALHPPARAHVGVRVDRAQSAELTACAPLHSTTGAAPTRNNTTTGCRHSLDEERPRVADLTNAGSCRYASGSHARAVAAGNRKRPVSALTVERSLSARSTRHADDGRRHPDVAEAVAAFAARPTTKGIIRRAALFSAERISQRTTTGLRRGANVGAWARGDSAGVVLPQRSSRCSRLRRPSLPPGWPRAPERPGAALKAGHPWRIGRHAASQLR